MSSGSFCRSPSDVTTTSPRERSKPAEKAAVWPKLRRRTTARTRGSSASSASSFSRVPSVLPSSTSTSSNERPVGRRARQLAVQVLEVHDLVVERDDDRDPGARFSVHAGPSICDGPLGP